ncbi:RanBP2-type domain-containing protein [Citrus sinensis]|nr:RanBP2-type domain-containing protein [Citrus sinensis]
MSSWACKKCTFLNSPSRKSTCQICLTPSSSFSPPSKSSVSVPTWSCKACTFLNPYNNTSCELCNTRAPVSGLSSFEDLTDPALDSELDSSVGSVFLPLQLKACTGKRKIRDQDCDGDFDGFRGTNSVSIKDDTTSGPSADNSESGAVSGSLKILSYNVWFREDLEMHPRMKTIGDLIQLHSPDIICFQEITPNIYDILCKSSWWKGYRCSVPNEMADSRGYFCMQLSKLQAKSFTCEPFRNSIMGRELCVAEVEVQGKKPLVVATSHLESPCPGPPTWDQMFSKERVEQAKEAINLLKKNPNVIFCGDMNWDDKLDGKFPLPDGWVDAWTELRPGENGWTYDTKSNKMLSGNRTLQKRLDRFICSLRDFKIIRIDMIGVEAIPGLLYVKEKKVRKEMQKLELPVLPSDHYGLLLTISNNIG